MVIHLNSKIKPTAFMSYRRIDEKHLEGKFTEFRSRLSAEVELQTGVDFQIFQDVKNLKWGDPFGKIIKLTLDEVMFLIPMITPGFFNSDYCRDELTRFLKREEEMGRNNLILPVLYIDCPILTDKDQLEKDELATIIASRNYVDWRDLRFDPPTSPHIGKKFAELASQIRDAVEPELTVKKKTKPKQKSPKKAEQPTEATPLSSHSSAKTKTPTLINEPPTHIVHQMHRGDFASITEAIEAAKPGDRILIRPGHYIEDLVINKPLEIIGDGERDDIVVEAKKEYTISFQASIGRISNLTLRKAGGDENHCVDISQGRLELLECDITCKRFCCIGVYSNADPRIRNNIIHDARYVGIAIYNQGQGVIEDNDIFGNGYSGMEIRDESNPSIRRNRIHDGKRAGLFIHSEGQGIIEDNDIIRNGLFGIASKENGNPTVRNNRIMDNHSRGIRVYDNGKGTFENNELSGNKKSNLLIDEDCKPNVKLSGNIES
jgi:parallel beta-helix repeat protein